MPRRRNVTGGVQLRFRPLEEVYEDARKMALADAIKELQALDPEEWKQWYDAEVAPLPTTEDKLTAVVKENLRMKQMDAMDRLMELDPDGWEEWFDNDDNVPAFGDDAERLEILNARINELTKEKRNEEHDDL